jgi:hypothetical protein
MTTTDAKPIAFHIDGHEVGRGRIWNGVLIDVSAKWSTDPKIVAAVNSNIERAIGMGHNAITFTDDSGQRTAITWRVEE